MPQPPNPPRAPGFDDDAGPSPIDLELALFGDDDLPDDDPEPADDDLTGDPEAAEPDVEELLGDELAGDELAGDDPTDGEPAPEPEPDEAQPVLAAPSRPASAIIRAEAAAIELTIPGLHDAFAGAALAAYGDANNPELQTAAEAARARLCDAQARLEMLRAAIPVAEQQEAEQAAAARAAERQRQRAKLVRKLDRIADKWAKEDDYIKAKTVLLTAAAAERDELAQEWRTADLKCEVLNENIASATTRQNILADEHLALDEDLTAFDNPPHVATAAEEMAARAAAHADRIAAMEAETDRQLHEICDAEIVPVEAARVPSDGDYKGWRFERGLVIGVPRRDLDRLAAEKARAAEEDAADKAEAAARDPRPWRRLQGSPFYFGLETARAAWRRTAPQDEIEFVRTVALARGDHSVIGFLDRNP